MFDWDAVIIGGGPAGLTAGLYLARANYRTVVLDKDSPGGYPKNVALIENYPGFSTGVSGAQLASEMVAQAAKYGLQFDQGEVNGIELFSSCRWVGCSNGRGYTTAVAILAGGSRLKKLGIPGEETFQGRGVFECALCDGDQFTDKTVAVCGGGEAALTEALYMARLASRVFVIHRRDALRAARVLQDRAFAEPKIEFIWNSAAKEIKGNERVENISVFDLKRNTTTDLPVDGVLIHVGVEPNTGYLDGIVPLDSEGQVTVNSRMETEVPYILAAGDVRSGSPRQITAAVGDGAIAGITATRLLQELA